MAKIHFTINQSHDSNMRLKQGCADAKITENNFVFDANALLSTDGAAAAAREKDALWDNPMLLCIGNMIADAILFGGGGYRLRTVEECAEFTLDSLATMTLREMFIIRKEVSE